MERRASAVALAVVLTAAAISLPAAAQSVVRVFVDGTLVAFDQPPVIQGSRVLVPLRGVFEQMGATVEWRAVTRTVLAASGSTLVELQIGSRIARVNGQPVTLDVPAMIIGGRTLVPLRFISESLGASVEWNAATRTVIITSGQAGGPPVGQPPAQPPRATTIRGTITNVILAQSPQDMPRIVVQSGHLAYTIRITTDTAISRVESSTGAGGSVGVAALRPGDEVEVTLAGDVATRIRARFLETTGRIAAIAGGGRTVVLTDGRTITMRSEATVFLNGQQQAGGIAALRVGQVVQFRLNPETREAWEANILAGLTQVPGQMTLVINQPAQGATVGTPIRIVGRTVPNARVDVSVSWFLGIPAGEASATANANGRFVVNVPVRIVLPNTPYTITVTATHPQFGQEQVQFNVTVSPEAAR